MEAEFISSEIIFLNTALLDHGHRNAAASILKVPFHDHNLKSAMLVHDSQLDQCKSQRRQHEFYPIVQVQKKSETSFFVYKVSRQEASW